MSISTATNASSAMPVSDCPTFVKRVKSFATTPLVKEIAKSAFLLLGIVLGAVTGAVILSAVITAFPVTFAALPVVIVNLAGVACGINGSILGGFASNGLLKLAKKTHHHFIDKKANQTKIR